MLKKAARPFLIFATLFIVGAVLLMDQGDEKVIVVDLSIENPQDVEKAYMATFDGKKVTLEYDFEDTLSLLADFAMEEDPLVGPGCFLPEMKLIYERYTYIVSLYCTSVARYKNKTAFVPSNIREPNDLEITSSVLEYLQKIRKSHFGSTSNPDLAKKFKVSSKEFKDEDVDINLDDEEDDLDLDFEDDEDGMFDDVDLPEESLDDSDD